MNTQEIILKHLPTAGENLINSITQIINDCRLLDNTEVNKSEVINIIHKLWRRDVITLKMPLYQWLQKAHQEGRIKDNSITLNNIQLIKDKPTAHLINLINNEQLFLSPIEINFILK